MAQVKSRTLILDQAPGTDYLENPQLSALLASGWSISSMRATAGDPSVAVTMVRAVELEISAPLTEESIIWQGRPPFPGILKHMPKNIADPLNGAGSTGF